MKGKYFIGTSGWNYPHWVGNFYPEKLKKKEHFKYYQQRFDTVEINNSFYRLPDRETFAAWRKASEDDFVFVVKANRFITHMKKLKEPEDALKRLLYSARGLGKKLGPILFQLPPTWKLNISRFEYFLKQLPRKKRFVFEFRNTTWYVKEVYDLLEKYNCAFCIYELAGHRSPFIDTADFVYIRLHGPGNKYQGSYPDETIKFWALKCKSWAKKKKDVYVYFDNDQRGYAAFNALTLKKMLGNM